MKKVLIIGGGIAGLSAGCYARMNGYDTEIYEMHSIPGGLCTAWKRLGYTMDGCIHWLAGSAPGSDFYEFWSELGAVQNRRMFNHDAFFVNQDKNGRRFILYSDVNLLEKHMKELSPEDSLMIDEFCNYIRAFSKFNFDLKKPKELMNIIDLYQSYKNMKPMMQMILATSKITISEYAKRFKDPLIRTRLASGMSSEGSLIRLITTMASLNNKMAGFPEGGSLEFAKAIEKRYLSLGGKIFYKKCVDKILIQNHQVSGIRLKDGKEITGDIIISAGDAKHALDHLLEGKYPSPHLEKLFDHCEKYSSSIQVTFGLNTVLKDEIDAVGHIYQLSVPIEIAGKKVEWLSLKNYGFDKTLAPEGKSVVMSMIYSDIEYWEKLYSNQEIYKQEKAKVGQMVLNELEKITPGIRKKVEVIDVATPITYVRYTGTWEGRYMSWKMNPVNMRQLQNIPKQIQGLKNFYLAGKWLMSPGGLPSALKTARDVIQMICRKDHKNFVTSKPE